MSRVPNGYLLLETTADTFTVRHRVEATTDTEDGEPGFIATGTAAGLEVICGAIQVSENVKLC